MTAKIAITCGDPAGVGPDIALSLARYSGRAELHVFGDRETLAQRAAQLGKSESDVDALRVTHIPTDAPVRAGIADAANAAHVLRQLDAAFDACMDGSFDALVTAPVSKRVLSEGKQAFVGHTDYFGERCGAHPVMLFVAGDLRIALLTTHLPLRAVADAITATRLSATARILTHDLQRFFGIERPRITVCGLNPHAGEGGQLGDEEATVLAPTIDRLRDAGIRIRGPVSADTAFVPRELENSDVFIGMFHDQVLPLVKHIAFDTAVNVTLGLPFARTSVDHGTAFDIAGSGRADATNLHAAVALAERMVADARRADDLE